MIGEEGFRIVCEVESPTRPDLAGVAAEVQEWSGVTSSFLAPDSHIGRATISSVAVASEVARAGGRPTVCLNARDRNLIGFRRDLLTAAAYGIRDVLLVFGDRPKGSPQASDLTVRAMLAETRYSAPDIRVGVTARLEALPDWKRSADALFVQCAFSADDLLAWRATLDFNGPIYAGVLTLQSAAMARRLSARVPELRVPAACIEALERDPASGVDMTCDLIDAIADSCAFDGVHLISLGRHHQLAARLRTSALSLDRQRRAASYRDGIARSHLTAAESHSSRV